MLYSIIAFVVAVVAFFIIYRAAKMLWSNTWFMAWLRGTLGLAAIAIAIVIGLIAYDIYTYKPILLEQPVATVSFESSEPQHFVAIVVGRNGKEQRFNLNGDQWQLDTRLIKWRGLLSALDIKPGYRLDRLSGRFYDIQKETAENRTSYSIINSLLALDVWRCMHNHANWFPVADTSYGSATYLPMKKGALYEIYLSNIGLVARPLNDVAKKAVDEWH